MAFPTTPQNSRANNITTATTAPVLTCPTGLAIGSLVLVTYHVTQDSTTAITFPSGFTKLLDVATTGWTSQDRIAIAYKFLQSGDAEIGAASITLTTFSSRGAGTMHRIEGAGTPELSSNASGSSTGPDPPNFTPSFGAVDTKWFAICFWEGEQTIPPTFPTNYSTAAQQSSARSGTAGNVDLNGGVSIGPRDLNAASENPGAFTLSAADEWWAYTLAVPPAAGGTPQLMAATLASTSDLQAALQVEKLLSATLASVGEMSPSVQVVKQMATTLASTSTTEGKLNEGGVLMAATLASDTTLQAILLDEKILAAILASSGEVNASLLDAKTMQTVMASTSTLAAAIQDHKALATLLSSQGFLNADLQDELPSVGRMLRLLLGVGR